MQSETVVRLRPMMIEDPYSGEETEEDWSAAYELPMQTLAPAEPRPSSEPTQDARNSVTSGYTLYMSPGSDITSKDRMRVRGVVFKVIGEPSDWMGAGIVVQVSNTDG